MSETDKREKKKHKKHKSKVNGDVATNTENTEVEKVKKRKDKSHKQQEISEPEPEQKKIKKRKNKNITTNTENIEEKQQEGNSGEQDAPKTKKNKKKASVSFTPETIDNEPEASESPSKRQKTTDLSHQNIETRLPTEEELLEVQKPQNKKDVPSKRLQKRLKHEKLLADNKLKQDAAFQEKALNYLSRWKHNRPEWKFEKLRQVWLQNHMFDSAALPDKFFDTLVEYFGGSKGRIKQVLIDTCQKIVDEAEGNDEVADSGKFKRARTLLQHLQ